MVGTVVGVGLGVVVTGRVVGVGVVVAAVVWLDIGGDDVVAPLFDVQPVAAKIPSKTILGNTNLITDRGSLLMFVPQLFPNF